MDEDTLKKNFGLGRDRDDSATLPGVLLGVTEHDGVEGRTTEVSVSTRDVFAFCALLNLLSGNSFRFFNGSLMIYVREMEGEASGDPRSSMPLEDPKLWRRVVAACLEQREAPVTCTVTAKSTEIQVSL